MMNSTLFARLSIKRFLWLCLIVAGAWRLPAADEVSKNLIQQSRADQQDIRSHTATMVAQVQSLIDELAANGISGSDNQVLEATKAALANLSGPEMEEVIGALQKAGEAPDVAATEKDALTAYTGQKGIILQFEAILKEYAQRQAAYELPLRFKELADRQTETLRVTMEVAARTVGQSASELSSMDSTTEQIVRSDQAAIANDVNLAQSLLEKAAQSSSDGDAAKNMQQALQDLQSGKLQAAMTQAEEDINAGQLLKASGDQKVARDELRRITRDLNPPADAVEALTSLEGDLAQLIDAQKKLLDQTNGSITAKTLDAGLKDKQISLVDKADVLQQDMLTLTPAAAVLVKGSIMPMQMSRSQLGDLGGFPQAAKSQQEAIAKLEEAQKQLEQKIADAEKAAEDANKDPVEKLTELQQKVQAEIQQQQQIAQQTLQTENAAAPDEASLSDDRQKQSQLEQQNAALQPEAQASSLRASEDLADAQTRMDQAQKSLTDPAKAAGAEKAQADALTALQHANKELDQQIAEAKQQSAAPADLAAMSDALQKAQDELGDAQNAASPAPPGSPDTAAADKALADANADAEAAAQMAGLPQGAGQDVKEAEAEIAAGEKAAGQKNAPGTAGHAAAAQRSLAKAQSKVASAQAAAGAAMAGNSPASQVKGPPGPPGRISGKTVSHSTHIAGGNNTKGVLHAVDGADKFIALAQRQRDTIGQSQEEKRPLEYAPMIDQYMKNLADQASAP
jgi:hypothetical protein